MNSRTCSTNDQSALKQVEREHDCDSSTLFEIIFGSKKKKENNSCRQLAQGLHFSSLCLPQNEGVRHSAECL